MKTIAYITDLHLDETFPKEHGVDARANWELILADVKSKNIDEIIFGGDIGEPAAYEYFFDSLYDFRGRYKIILGNHDRFAELTPYYQNKRKSDFLELYYSGEDEIFKNIFLDSSADSISEVQLEWFKLELDTTKKIMLFIHHPVLEVKTAVDKLYPLHGREKIEELLLKHDNEVKIFCGHYHMSDVRTENNIVQSISPSVSYQVKKNADVVIIETSTFGYRLINVDEGEIFSEVLLFKNGKFEVED